MSGDPSERKNKRTIVVENVEHGTVRIAVVGSAYLVSTGSESTRDLATHDIGEVWLSNFVPDADEDRAAYSAKHCTDTGSLHINSTGCDGLCHDLNCFEPADFFQHWRGVDGKDRCIPLCKWHSHDLNFFVGRAVLWALQYGVVADLRFWTQEDPLPGGLPRCDYGYYAPDSDGDSVRARCTFPATKRVKITEHKGQKVLTYEAKLCTRCAAKLQADAQTIEIMGDIAISPILAPPVITTT
jgi:hypothetical protein